MKKRTLRARIKLPVVTRDAITHALTVIAWDGASSTSVATLALRLLAGEEPPDKSDDLTELHKRVSALTADDVALGGSRLRLHAALVTATAVSARIRSNLAILTDAERAQAQAVLSIVQGFRSGLSLALNLPGADQIVVELSNTSNVVLDTILARLEKGDRPHT